MTLDVKALAAKELAKVKLRILLFGPQVTPPSDNPYIACLQVKRETIRNELEAVGHEVLYGEDFVDPSLPPPLSNPAYQEIAVMRDADLIVVLVASPGSIGEATLIVREDGLRRKSHFFCFSEHAAGFVVSMVTPLIPVGLCVDLTSLDDTTACQITGVITEKAEHLRYAKAFYG